MKKLLITEKPLIARQLAKVGVFGNPNTFKIHDGIYFENENYIIVPCQGHIFERPFPYEVNPIYSFAYKKVEGYDYASPSLLDEAILKPKPSAKKIIYALKTVLSRKDIDEIAYVGDADAEGEQIVRNAVKNLGKHLSPSIKHTRVFNAGSFDNKATIEKVWNERKPLNTPLYENLNASGNARESADYYMGMVFCRLYSDKTESKFRYGRVWIAILSLLCNREFAIKNFKPRNYHNIKANLDGIVFTAFKEEEQLNEVGIKEKVHTTKFFDDETPTAEKVIHDVKSANYTGKVLKYNAYETHSKKPLLYNLNDFNAHFMKKYNVSAKYSEACIEFLRFKDYVTYSRTDGNYYATVEIDKVKQIQEYCKQNYNDKINDLGLSILPVTHDLPVFNDKEAAKQIHEPIVITRSLTEKDIKFLKSPQFSMEDSKLELKHLWEAYQLVATRCMIQFLPNDKVAKENVVIEIGGHQFETSTERTLELGWKAFDDDANIYNGKALNYQFVENSPIKVDDIKAEKNVTKPPKRYTETALFNACSNVKKALIEEINAVENESERSQKMERFTQTAKLFDSAKGIGTQGTLKAIFEKAKNDKVLDFDKKELYPTDYGWFVFNTIHPYLKSLELTAIFESYLIDIRSGQKTYTQFRKEFINDIVAPLARSEAERDIALAPKQTSEKIINYAQNIAKKLNLTLPDISDAKALMAFIEQNKPAYDATFSQLPDYLRNTLIKNKDKLKQNILDILEKDTITKEDYIAAMTVYKTLPKTYDSFLDAVIEKANKNADKLGKEIMEIIQINEPTPDEYIKVMNAINNLSYTLSDKQKALLDKNLDKLSKKDKTLYQSKSEYTGAEMKQLRAAIDKLFNKK